MNIDPKLRADFSHGKLTSEEARELLDKVLKEELIGSFTFPSAPSSDGYYHLNIKDDSKKTGRRQIKAKTLDELKEKVYQSEFGDLNPSIRQHFSEVFELMLQSKLRYTRRKDRRVSRQNTLSRYRNDYNRYIAGRKFENLYIDEIRKKDIERLFDEILREEDIRPKAMQGIRLIIGMTFKYAFCEEMIMDNPFARVDFAKYKDALQDTVSISERIHTDEEIRLIRDEIALRQSLRPDYIPAYALELQMLMCGRRGEIPVLEWNDFHLDAEVPYIHISKEQLTAKKSEDTPKETFVIADYTKTHKDRRFPVTDEIREFLVKLKTVHEKYGLKSRYLFPADNENGIITNNAVYNLYRRICKKLSIPISMEKMRGPHSFRRNGITDFVNSGGNLLMASKLYGNTPQVAENNYYAGLDLKNAADIINKKESVNRENGQ